MPSRDGQDDHPQEGRHHDLYEKASAWCIPRLLGQAGPVVQPYASQNESHEATKTQKIPREE